MNQTNTKVQNANTATAPDTTMVMSSLSAFLSHLRICASRKEPADDHLRQNFGGLILKSPVSPWA
jgi:hypothetical protein